MTRSLAKPALAAALIAAGPALAADPEAGAAAAADWCAECHDVAPGGAFKEYPPSFAAIAVYRSPEQIRGRIQYPPQHARMPQLGMMLSREEIENLVAYIVSLEDSVE